MKKHTKIAIIGGGTAGWLAANLFAKRWSKEQVSIEVIDSSEIGPIGVGEGSTPTLKRFFELIQVDEAKWMPKCDATYKTNIRFSGWSPKAPAPSYSHPFFSQVDIHTEQSFVKNCLNRRHGYDAHTAPEDFFLNGVLANKSKAPITGKNFPFRIEYGYHFDSVKLGHFLSDLAQSRGVTLTDDRMTTVYRRENGDISSIRTAKEKTIEADFFIDCTGFAALLMSKELDIPFKSFAPNLFNDAAVVMQTPACKALPSETKATALSNGWCWQIPLRNRTGNGYVYSSNFTSADDAELEVRKFLGLDAEKADARHLKMKVGQLERHWDHNCLAIGLSQGFLEPLEATALHLALNTIEGFMNCFESGQFTSQNRDQFNISITHKFESVRDYIVAHYKLNTRDDTEYWRANRHNDHLSPQLRQIIRTWSNIGDLSKELRQLEHSHFNNLSWHCLLAGYGTFPPLAETQRKDIDFYKSQKIEHFLSGCSLNFPYHNDALSAC